MSAADAPYSGPVRLRPRPIPRAARNATFVAIFLGLVPCGLARLDVPPVIDVPTSWTRLDQCARLSLWMFGRLTGREWSHSQVTEACEVNERGASSVADLCRAGQRLGCPMAGVRCLFDDLERLVPGIVYYPRRDRWPAHFCVAALADTRRVYLIDPPYYSGWVDREGFLKIWDGIVVVPAVSCGAGPVGWHRAGLALGGFLSLIAGVALHRLVSRPALGLQPDVPTPV